MKNYRLTFDNGQVIEIKIDLTNPKSYMNAQAFCVDFIEKNKLSNCQIIKHDGSIGLVKKTGNWHWNHNGYSFS
jgi:hypothetical protein